MNLFSHRWRLWGPWWIRWTSLRCCQGQTGSIGNVGLCVQLPDAFSVISKEFNHTTLCFASKCFTECKCEECIQLRLPPLCRSYHTYFSLTLTMCKFVQEQGVSMSWTQRLWWGHRLGHTLSARWREYQRHDGPTRSVRRSPNNEPWIEELLNLQGRRQRTTEGWAEGAEREAEQCEDHQRVQGEGESGWERSTDRLLQYVQWAYRTLATHILPPSSVIRTNVSLTIDFNTVTPTPHQETWPFASPTHRPDQNKPAGPDVVADIKFKMDTPFPKNTQIAQFQHLIICLSATYN